VTRRDNLDALPFSGYADPDPHGQLRIGDEPQPPRVEVLTMNRGTTKAFDRVFLYCPNGHDCGSAPVGFRDATRWLAGDTSGEWCGHGSCGWRS